MWCHICGVPHLFNSSDWTQKVRVFVITSDKYLGALRPFAYLFNKYWSPEQQVVVMGFAEPSFDLPDNFTFHSMGSMRNYPVGNWSDALIAFLNQVDDEVFCLMLEDYWINKPVDQLAIKMLYDYMIQFQYVLKMDLGTDRLYAAGVTDYGQCGNLNLLRSDPGSQYHMSLMCGLWRRDLLLRFLIPGESPWQVELSGTPRVAAAADSVLVLGTRNHPLSHILAHRRGNPNELLLDGLDADDIKALVKLEYI